MLPVRIAREDAVLRVTLARPERRNALDATLIGELTAAFVDVGDARAVLLAGDGPAFCAGADVDWMRRSIGLSPEENVADAAGFLRMLEAIESCPAPVVVRVHGSCLGGATGLVAAADIAVAAEDAVFGLPEVRLGLIPATISPFLIARIGPGAARRYFVTGERIDAAEALRIGLVHEVAADADAACERILQAILEGGPEAVRAAKRLVLDAPAREDTPGRLAERRTSAEAQARLGAFLDRRRQAP